MLLAAAAAVAVLAGAAYLIWSRGRDSDSIRLPMERFTLANGLPVVLSVDHATPTFTLAIMYKTGARSDPPGRDGLAHVVSHLMFNGSPNVAPGEFFGLLQSVGGVSNDQTYADADAFWSTLPSNQLELALFLESDRMRALEVTPAGINEARSTLIEEQRGRVDNTPYGHALLLLHKMAFDNPINQRTGYGVPEVLNSITVEEAARFHQEHYMPSNAALALVGDFDAKKARERIEHYFGSIPQRPAPPRPDTKEPGRTAEARATITDPTARAPLVMMAWRVPPMSDPDWFLIFTFSNLLGGGLTSRLQSTLVKGSGVASDLQVALEDNSGGNLMFLNLVGAPGKDLSQAEAGAHQEIDRIGREGVPSAELERLYTDEARTRALQMVTTTARGFALARLLGTHNRPEGLNLWESRARSVKSEDLQRIVKQYFAPANRTVLYVYPPGAAPGGSSR